jgi:hypothetical protein
MLLIWQTGKKAIIPAPPPPPPPPPPDKGVMVFAFAPAPPPPPPAEARISANLAPEGTGMDTGLDVASNGGMQLIPDNGQEFPATVTPDNADRMRTHAAFCNNAQQHW